MRPAGGPYTITMVTNGHPPKNAFFLLLSTLTSSTGLKTRHFGTIIAELTASLRIHASCNSRLGGVSLEFTGELNDKGFSVTECLGGSMELSEEQLGLRYQVTHTIPHFLVFGFC